MPDLPTDTRRRTLWVVAALYLLCLAPLYGDNENRAHALLWALDTQQQLTIAEAPFPTGDYALLDGRVYAGAAPGVAFTALPAYALTRRVTALVLSSSQAEVAGYLAAILLAAVLPTCLAVWAFDRATADAQPDPDAAAARRSHHAVLLFALGSLVFPYASRLMPPALVVGALSVSIWAATRALGEPDPDRTWRWSAIAGAAAGLAVCANYTAALAACGLAALLVGAPGDGSLRARRLGGLLLGALPLALGLGLYHQLAFGSPFTTAYHHPGTEAIREAVSRGWLGYQLPTLSTLGALSVGFETGLFVYCPAAAIGLLGAGVAARAAPGPRRQLAWLALALSAAYFLLNAARLGDYHAGHAHGPRYLLVALPFLLWFLPEGLARLPRPAFLALAALSYGTALLGVFSATHYWPQGASLLRRLTDVAEAGPRLPWLFVWSRSTGAVRESLVPLLSGGLLLACGGAAAWVWRERDRPLAALGLGLAVSALALLL